MSGTDGCRAGPVGAGAEEDHGGGAILLVQGLVGLGPVLVVQQLEGCT